MRIEELHIERFGHFEGYRLNLSGKDVRLHVVYGPNEAGKSTVLSAICDLLFGIPKFSQYAFRHEYGQLRIGATISNETSHVLEFKRRKSKTLAGTLLSPDESTVLPDNSLAPFLDGIDRETFERLFALNHERLRAGGKAMLAAGGDIARSLFEAGSGILGLASVLKGITDDADAIGLGRKAASKPYWQAHDRYETAIETMRSEALKADAWNAAEKAVAAAQERRGSLGTALAEFSRRRSVLERIRRTAPLLRRVDDLVARLSDLGEGTVLPQDFEETWRSAKQAEQIASEHAKSRSAALEEFRAALEQLGDAGPWPAFSARIDKLTTDLGDYRTKLNDLPHRIRDQENGRKQMAELIRQLGANISPEDVGKQRPSDPAIARVRSLIGEWHRIDAALGAAEKEFQDSDRLVEETEAAIIEAGVPPDPSEASAAFEEAAQFGDISSRITTACRDVKAADDELSRLLACQGRWPLDAAALARASLPAADLAASFDKRFTKLDVEAEAADKDLDAARKKVRRLEGEIETVRAGGEVPTPEVLNAARDFRDHGWRLVRRRYVDGLEVGSDEISAFAPNGDMAERFETAVAGADELADRRQDEAARVEKFATLVGQKTTALSEVDAATRKVEQVRQKRLDLEKEWTDAWGTNPVTVGTPSEMRNWLTATDKVIAQLRTKEKAELAVTVLKDDERSARADLLRCAALLGIAGTETLDFPALRDKVKVAKVRAEERSTQADALQETLTTRKKDRDSRKATMERVERQLEEWNSRWAAEMPIIGQAVDSSTVEAEAALTVWEKIGSLATDLAQTQRRREQIEGAIELYERTATDVLADLGAPAKDIADEDDFAAVVKILQERLSEAAIRQKQIEQATLDVSKAETSVDEAANAADEAAQTVRSLRDKYGLAEDAGILELAKKSAARLALSAELETARKDLLGQGDGGDEETLRNEATGKDIDAAAAEVLLVESEIARVQRELEEAAQAVTAAEADVRRLKERQGIGAAAQAVNDAAAEMGEWANRWLRLRAAGLLLAKAVERYRATNQHPLVQRADQIFDAIAAATSDNPIVRLSVDYTDEENPVLVGSRRDGSKCPVAGMSDGTLDQLYLSLRIAAIERYIDGAQALPFIADDLFITSDDERTVPGILALAELGKRTQVLLFTHHHYVVEAAKTALGPDAIRIHCLQRAVEAVAAAP